MATSRTPRYAPVVEALQAEISDGDRPVGSCLPTEHQLMRRFGVSRFTVRSAIAQLRDRGLVEPRPGLGTIVMSERERSGYVQKLASLEELLQYPRDTWRETHWTGEARPDAAHAALLDCAVSAPWVRMEAVRRVNPGRRAIAYIDAWIAPRLGDVVEQPNPESDPLLVQIEQWHGQQPAKSEVEIEAQGLRPELADLFDAEPGSPALSIRRRYRDDGGQVYLMTVSVHPPNRFKLDFEFDRT